jgi:lysophospholipase L1-like esterase
MPRYIARTGWTTADLQNAITGTRLQPPYDLVTLLIGVNDQFQGMDTAGYRSRFTQLLQKAIELAGAKISHVFVLSIPDYGVTPFGGGSAKISKEINEFNAINKAVTAAFKITYIDITPISRQAGTDQSLTAGDGLHPSAKQYQQWAMKLSLEMLGVIRP